MDRIETFLKDLNGKSNELYSESDIYKSPLHIVNRSRLGQKLRNLEEGRTDYKVKDLKE